MSARAAGWEDASDGRAHALLLGHQLQGGVTGHVGGIGLPLDHGGHDGPFHEQGHDGGHLRRRLANDFLNQTPQELAKALLVSPHELGAGVGGGGQFGGGVLEGATPEPRRLEPLLEGGEEGPQWVLRFLAVPLHRRTEKRQHALFPVFQDGQD